MADMLQVKLWRQDFAYFIDQQGVRARRFNHPGYLTRPILTQLRPHHLLHRPLYRREAQRLGARSGIGAEVTVADFSRIDDTESLFIDRINRSMDSYGATYSSKTIQAD